MDREQIEITHMPWGYRLWWQGWRKAMTGLVVLVTVAWGMRPSEAELRAALRAHGAIEATGRFLGIGTQMNDQWLWSTLQLRSWHRVLAPATDDEDPRPIIELGSDGEPVIDSGALCAIGAFGYVWVLD